MKRLAPLALALFLSSCSAVLAPVEDLIKDQFVSYPYIEEPLEIAWNHVAKYRYIFETGNYLKSPYEFEQDGGGDCEDFAGDLVYHLGREASCAAIRRPHDLEPHAVVRYRGSYLYIEPQRFGKTYDPAMMIPITSIPELDLEFMSAEISYDAVMKLSTAFYTK